MRKAPWSHDHLSSHRSRCRRCGAHRRRDEDQAEVDRTPQPARQRCGPLRRAAEAGETQSRPRRLCFRRRRLKVDASGQPSAFSTCKVTMDDPSRTGLPQQRCHTAIRRQRRAVLAFVHENGDTIILDQARKPGAVHFSRVGGRSVKHRRELRVLNDEVHIVVCSIANTHPRMLGHFSATWSVSERPHLPLSVKLLCRRADTASTITATTPATASPRMGRGRITSQRRHRSPSRSERWRSTGRDGRRGEWSSRFRA